MWLRFRGYIQNEGPPQETNIDARASDVGPVLEAADGKCRALIRSTWFVLLSPAETVRSQVQLAERSR